MRTGDKTAIGTIAKLAYDTEQRESWLQKVVAIVAVHHDSTYKLSVPLLSCLDPRVEPRMKAVI
jgi:hypothetical protein